MIGCPGGWAFKRLESKRWGEGPTPSALCLYGGKVFNEKTTEGGWVKGAHATVETSGQLDKRITATRLILTGPLAFGFGKRKTHASYS